MRSVIRGTQDLLIFKNASGGSMSLVRTGQAVLIAVASLAGPLSSAANAITTTAPGQRHAKFTASLAARHSGKCLDVAGGSTADGANVHQWTCADGQRNQEWNFMATSNGYYTLRATHSDKCLDVVGGSTADRANIDQWTCGNAQDNQQWRLAQRNDGYFAVVNRNSGKCLDVAGGSTADGANVHQWTCADGQRNQEWKFA
jgi:Ricin-type beta-trefoil lectin domain